MTSNMSANASLDVSTTEQIVFGAIYIVLGPIGVVLNIAITITFLIYPDFRSAPYIWMSAIALADTVLIVLVGIYSGVLMLTTWVPPYIIIWIADNLTGGTVRIR